MTQPIHDWRDESGIKFRTVYKRKFAWIKVKCSDGSSVWLKPYFKKYLLWSSVYVEDDMFDDSHRDFIENISEEDYIVRKLAESL